MIAYFDEGSQWRFCTSILVKAFNKVPHKRLVTKVKAHGTGSNIWRRIEAWLSDRSQRVVINGACIRMGDSHTSGLPQGSILFYYLGLHGSLFVNINDIDDGITSSPTKIC